MSEGRTHLTDKSIERTNLSKLKYNKGDVDVSVISPVYCYTLLYERSYLYNPHNVTPCGVENLVAL